MTLDHAIFSANIHADKEQVNWCVYSSGCSHCYEIATESYCKKNKLTTVYTSGIQADRRSPDVQLDTGEREKQP